MTMVRTVMPFAVAAFFAVFADNPASAQIALKFGHIVDTNHPIHMGATAMAAHVNQCSGGSVRIDIFPNGQLGNESALNDQTRLGTVDFANTGASFLSRNFAHLGVSSVPYIFRDRNHALAYARSDVLKDLIGEFEKATSQVILSAYYSSAFHIMAQDAYDSPDKLKGKKIRVPDAPAWLVFYKAIGANPVPIALGETYLALRQGVVDGTNMPLAVGYSQKLHEVTKVVSMTFHQMEIGMLITGPHLRGRLSPAQQACLQAGAAIYGDLAQTENVKLEDGLRDRMTKEGLIKFADVDLAAYQKSMASVIAEKVRAGEFPQALIDRIQAIR
jgi:tripartite ATP-independent transporter DctP family solute receptor